MITALELEHGAELDLVPTLLHLVMEGIDKMFIDICNVLYDLI